MRVRGALPRRPVNDGSERSRILRDLHDGLGPILTGMALGLHAARNLVRRDPESAARLLAQLEEEMHGALAEVRRLTDELRPSRLDELDLVEAIRLHAMALADRMTELHIEVRAIGELDSLALPVRVAVYRIICEALTNAVRHSGARSCVVSIRLDDDLTVEIIDDGIGIPDGATPPWSGVGLRSMRDRTTELGGVWAIEPGVPGGTRVAAIFPVHQN